MTIQRLKVQFCHFVFICESKISTKVSTCASIISFHKLENLSFSYFCSQYIYKRDLECCPIFGRLKTLLLDMWCRHVDMHALVRFLQHTPIIEKLTLQLCSDKVDFPDICYHCTNECVMYTLFILYVVSCRIFFVQAEVKENMFEQSNHFHLHILRKSAQNVKRN